MNNELIKQKCQELDNSIFDFFKNNFTRTTDDYKGIMYINIFKEFPITYKIYYDENGNLQKIHNEDLFQDIKLNIIKQIDDRNFLINMQKNMQKLKDENHYITIFNYSNYEYFIICKFFEENGEHTNLLIDITLSDNEVYENFIYVYTNNIDRSFNYIKDYCIIGSNDTNIEFGITAVSGSGDLYTSWYDYKNTKIDIDMNYNDSFKKPYEKICKLIENEDDSALMLFYGKPGTGKTSLIKHLISKYPGTDFIFLDGSFLSNIQQNKIMSYFLESQHAIFILEDCEKALVSREKEFNPIMSLLLNITDGIIGDVLGIKLICTFNTDLDQIDKALLRKGRLSLKYEFGLLNKEKTKKLIESLGKKLETPIPTEGMALSDIYNLDDDNDFSKPVKKKIGF